MRTFWKALRLFLWMTVLTGIVYPLIVTAIGQLTWKMNAKGRIVTVQNRPVGSYQIGQKFEKDLYFWPRPSAVDYNSLPSGGSNLGPTSSTLKKIVEERTIAQLKANPDSGNEVPKELLFASGSGLDPHISPKTAYYQIPRVAKARKIEEKKLRSLVDGMIDERVFGLIGERTVNVLMLNIALDELKGSNE